MLYVVTWGHMPSADTPTTVPHTVREYKMFDTKAATDVFVLRMQQTWSRVVWKRVLDDGEMSAEQPDRHRQVRDVRERIRTS